MKPLLLELAISITYFCVHVCVVKSMRVHASVRVCVGARALACAFPRLGLLIQYATRRRHSVCGLWLQHIFRHYLINDAIFGKKLLNIKCVFLFSLQLLVETFLILRNNERDIVVNMKTSSCEVPVIFLDFIETWIFSTDFRKIHKYQI